MNNFGLNCDVCNRQNVGVTWVNGMKFCAKCYQETFGASKDWQLLDKDKTIAEQRKQISDLEAKLAESELKYNATNRAYWELVEKQDNAFSQYEKLIGENQQLKQQLEEKDAEVQSWKDGTMVVKLCELEKQLAEKEKEIEKYKELCTISKLEDLQIENMLLMKMNTNMKDPNNVHFNLSPTTPSK